MKSTKIAMAVVALSTLFLNSAVAAEALLDAEKSKGGHPKIIGLALIDARKIGSQALHALETLSLLNGEVTAYAKCMKAYGAAGDDAAAQVAAYTPLFDGYKTNAKAAVTNLIQKLCPGDDDTQFLHDGLIINGSNLKKASEIAEYTIENRTRGGFIAWINGKIDGLTITDAVSGNLHFRGVTLPINGNDRELARFTTGLNRVIAEFAGNYVSQLGYKNIKSLFVTDEIKSKLYVMKYPRTSRENLEEEFTSYYPAEYIFDLRDMLHTAITS